MDHPTVISNVPLLRHTSTAKLHVYLTIKFRSAVAAFMPHCRISEPMFSAQSQLLSVTNTPSPAADSRRTD